MLAFLVSLQQVKYFKDGISSPTDDGGHMIGARFHGPVEQINYFPQEIATNRYGPWKNMEDEWYATLPKPNANPPVAGQSVKVEIKPVFDPPTSKRPKEFHITYWYGGSTTPASIQPNGDTFKTVENP